MTRFKITLVVSLMAMLLWGCWDLIPGSISVFKNNQYKTYKTSFSDTALPLSEFNTEYDDYNSDLHQVGDLSPLLFSTNRSSQGRQFDFITKFLDITFAYDRNILTIGEAVVRDHQDAIGRSASLYQLTFLVNNNADQLGPFLIPRSYHDKQRYQSYIFLYSSNEEGSQDIRFTHNLNTNTYIPTKPVAFLNSTADEAYPMITQDSSSLYFCSNRDGNFDIYSYKLNTSKGIVAELESTAPKTITKEPVFSSGGDDKCPFFFGNFMIFTSNRPGGFGGFDLYYSIYKNGAWSAPVNFGNKINTPADEYRPIVKLMDGYYIQNDFMIFSSNRPGGKGGFDLYYAGISQIRDNFPTEAELGMSNDRPF